MGKKQSNLINKISFFQVALITEIILTARFYVEA